MDINGPSAPTSAELSKDGQRAIASLRSIASLIVTSSSFRQLASDTILVSRDLLADAAVIAADATKSAADGVRPTDKERADGFDFDQAQRKGKQVAKGVKSGRLQGQARESLWDEVEMVKEYIDEKLPAGEEARDKVVIRLQAVSPSPIHPSHPLQLSIVPCTGADSGG